MSTWYEPKYFHFGTCFRSHIGSLQQFVFSHGWCRKHPPFAAHPLHRPQFHSTEKCIMSLIHLQPRQTRTTGCCLSSLHGENVFRDRFVGSQIPPTMYGQFKDRLSLMLTYCHHPQQLERLLQCRFCICHVTILATRSLFRGPPAAQPVSICKSVCIAKSDKAKISSQPM